MDFALSEEQTLLRNSVERLFADQYTFEARKRYAQEPGGFSSALWRQYAELGLLGLPFAEEDGGLAGGSVETMIVMEAIGRALALEPYLATVVLAGGLLRLGGSEALRRELIPQIAAGDLILAFAHSERQARYDLADVAATARRDGTGYVLDGAKTLVLHGDSAKSFVVSARVGGGQREQNGIALFIVDAASSGVATRGYDTVDGQRAAEVTLSGVRVGADAVIGDPGGAFPLIEKIADAAMAALAAEAVGAMAAMHELTVDYLKTRKQFGVTIGSFQALQHRAADMIVALEQARSMMYLAAMMADEDDAEERAKTMSAVKVQIGRSAKFIGEQAVQMHGGIAMTYEYKAGHLFKRLTMIDTAYGDADVHVRRLADRSSLFA